MGIYSGINDDLSKMVTDSVDLGESLFPYRWKCASVGPIGPFCIILSSQTGSNCVILVIHPVVQ